MRSLREGPSTWRLLVALLISVVLVACGGGAGETAAPDDDTAAPTGESTAGDAAAGEPIHVAGIFDITGALAQYGGKSAQGAELAAEEINAEGGINGRPLELELIDDASDETEASTQCRNVASNDQYSAIVGLATFALLACEPIVEQAGIPVVSPGSSTDIEFNEWIFRTAFILLRHMEDFIAQVSEEQGIETMSIMSSTQSEYNTQEHEKVKEGAEQAGVEIVGEYSFSADAVDFASELTEVQSANPDALFISAPSEQYAAVARQARDLGIEAQLLGGGNLIDPKIAELSRGAAVGAITMASYRPNSDREIVQQFIENYEAEFGEAPTESAALGYDAVLVLAEAMGAVDDPTDREAIRDALGQVSGLEGVVHENYTYEGKGDNTTAEFFLAEVTEDGLQPLDG